MSAERQVLRMTESEIQESIKNSLLGQDVEDYTFEERYCRGVERPVRPQQDELDRLHYLRLESIVSKKSWDIFSTFTNNCRAHPKKVAGLWLDSDAVETHRWTYAELFERSRVVAAHLVNTHKIQKGDRVLLAYEPCLEFFAAFWACVGTGIIAVPVCPPDPFNAESDMTMKLVSIWKDAQPKLILTSAKYKDSIAAARMLLGESTFADIMSRHEHILDVSKVLWIGTTRLDFIPASEWDFQNPETYLLETDVVFLQYTSGSTGGAKGVEVSHRQLGANCINCGFLTQGMGSLYVYQFSLGVSWLPTFHDMGLIGFHVAPMLIGGTMVYFSPLDFIKNPTMWLRIVSRYKHVSSGAPPFALQLCAQRITHQELAQLDLSSLEVLVLGAEPIRASYMEAFTQKFAAYGFNPKAYMTCYGMAENMLHVTGKWSNLYEARKILVDSTELAQKRLVVYKDKCIIDNGTDKDFYTQGPVVHTSTEDKDCQWLVSCGELIKFHGPTTLDPENNTPQNLAKRIPHYYRREISSYIAVVNPDTMEEVPDGEVGEIWICGPSKAVGYFNKPDINKKQFQATLKKAVKHQTKYMVDFAKRNAEIADPRVPRIELSTFTVKELEDAQEPMVKLLRYSMNRSGEIEWLRSGDMGVIYDDNLYITGRIKDMIIVRGQNYYADDLEHAVTGGKNAVDVNDGKLMVSGKPDPSLQALGWLRQASAVAYSIHINSDGSDDCLAKKYKVDGEHVCLIVELADDISEKSTSTSTNDDDDDDDEDMDGSENTDGNSGKEPAKLQKETKSGHQLPLWQRLALRYGGEIVEGMSRTHEAQEQELMKIIGGQNATVWRKKASCMERFKTTILSMCIGGARHGIEAAQALLKLIDKKDKGSVAQVNLAHRTTNTAQPDTDTMQTKAKFSDEKLDEIASAIRRIMGLRYLLSVGQIVFLAPRSVKKTSSGKKRRSEMVQLVESGEMEHRIVKRSILRPLQNYFQACEAAGKKTLITTNHGSLHNKISNTTKSNNSSNNNISSSSNNTNTNSMNNNMNTTTTSSTNTTTTTTNTTTTTLGNYAQNALSKYTEMLEGGNIQGVNTSEKQYGGTVGVSLDNNVAYNVDKSKHTVNIVDHANSKIERVLNAEPLLAPVEETAESTDEEAKKQALEQVEQLEKDAEALTFEIAKTKVLEIVVAKLNEITEGENVTVTVEYLREMATKSAHEQQQTLDEYGLDSMTGFELAKTLADAFKLPTTMMGPHLFLQDPTIDGMVGVLVKLVKLHAQKAREDYVNRYERQAVVPSQDQLTSADNTPAYIFRGSTDEKRIPYILAVGTAVPYSCAPQSEVMQAMMGPMKMCKKSEDRFIKLSENSGVQTRYSALNSLDQIFWGKEGVNQDNDEFVDARHAVYATESVKLSIRSAADALNDWMSMKVLKNDDQREKERLERYLEVDKKHRLHIAKKRAAEHGKTIDTSALDEPTEEELEDWSDLAKRVEAYTDRSITHVVAITCTGVLVPGLEFHIMQALGLPLTTQRLSIQFMGCFGAVSGIRCASALAAENPRNRVLVVCTELCTLHMQLNDKMDNLVASALFADGSGAMVIGCDPTPTERPLFAVHQCSSFVIPNTLQMMGWEMTRKGLIIGLAKEIASEIFNHIGDFVNNMLTHAADPKHPGHRIAAKNCNLGLHPGGPLILNTIQNVLNVPQVGDGHGGGDIDPAAPSAEAWEILREYGNMSSATLVFVLDRMREKAYKTDKWTPLVAFGPGLSVEGTLLKAVFPAPNKDGSYNRVAVSEEVTKKYELKHKGAAVVPTMKQAPVNSLAANNPKSQSIFG